MNCAQLRVSILFLSVSSAYGQNHKDLPKCSTEKINRTCRVDIDRKVPVAMPTLPMHPGEHIVVRLYNGLHFETVSLDSQTITALQGTDQIAGFVTAAIPNLKAFVGRSSLTMAYRLRSPLGFDIPANKLAQKEAEVQIEADKLRDDLKIASDASATRVQDAADDTSIIYAQLKEIQSPLPRPVLRASISEQRTLGVKDWTPRPWTPDGYKMWRELLLYELNGDDFDVKTLPTVPAPNVPRVPTNVIGDIGDLVGSLPSQDGTGAIKDPDNPIIDYNGLEDRLDTLKSNIAGLNGSPNQPAIKAKYDALVATEDHLKAGLLADSIFFAKVKTDLQSYYWNINRWSGNSDQTGIETTANLDNPLELGDISDPIPADKKLAPYKALGRQVAYVISVENQIATQALAVPTSSQKQAIVTITAVYGDPHFEVSAGAFLSSLPNRSFANYTTESISFNATPTPVDVRISQSLSHPEVLPFVAAHYRLADEHVWPGQRRFATYATVAVALNPYNSLPEFAAGPSFSWRAIMFSPLTIWDMESISPRMSKSVRSTVFTVLQQDLILLPAAGHPLHQRQRPIGLERLRSASVSAFRLSSVRPITNVGKSVPHLGPRQLG